MAFALVAGILAIGSLPLSGFRLGDPQRQVSASQSDNLIYTGSILFVTDDGSVCRQFLFDNRTGRVNDNGMVDCTRAYYQTADSEDWSADRAVLIGESFRAHGR